MNDPLLHEGGPTDPFGSLIADGEERFPISRKQWQALNVVGADHAAVMAAVAYAEGAREAHEWYRDRLKKILGIKSGEILNQPEEEEISTGPIPADELFRQLDE